MKAFHTPLLAYTHGLGAEPRYKTLRFGIELEFEGYNFGGAADGAEYWAREADPSLRNGGIELISRPLRESQVEKELQEVVSFINNSGVQATPRCGVHVHMNVGFMTCNQFWSLLATYLLAEPALFAQYAADRKDNHFCLPLWTQDPMIRALGTDATRLRTYDAERKAPLPMEFPHQAAKYSAVNFRTIRVIQTLEFRHLAGTADMDLVADWTKVLANLHRYSTKFEDPRDVVTEYEDMGVPNFLEALGLPGDMQLDEEDQSDAYEGAALICGHEDPQLAERLAPKRKRMPGRLHFADLDLARAEDILADAE